MSASAVLVIRVLTCFLGGDRSGLRAPTALWRQFPAHDDPCADQKGGADNRRRGERGEILQHERYLGLCGVAARQVPREHSAAAGHGCDVPAIALYPQFPGRQPAAPGGGRSPTSRQDAEENANKRSSIRVFPSVFGFTRSKSRNSATPSS